MTLRDKEFDDLATAAGVLPGYHDQNRVYVETSREARTAVLRGLGFDVESPSALRDATATLRARADRPLPRLVVVESDVPARVTLGKAASRDSVEWSLVAEDGSTRAGRSRAGAIELDALPMGYHHLTCGAGAGASTSLVLAAPRRCWWPAALEGEALGWGVAAQIYGLRGENPLGIGTYEDAGVLAEAAGRRGASFLGLSPVHALFAGDAKRYSPYSPSSRLFLQTWLIDPTAFGDDAREIVAAALAEPALARLVDKLRHAPLIDYDDVLAATSVVFEKVFASLSSKRDADFDAFCAERGEALRRHATFEALSEHFRARGLSWLGAWPEEYRRAGGAEVEQFAREEAKRVRFHMWLQYEADRQLADAARRASASGMELGLYRDLAVGADRGGSEVWSAPGLYAPTLSVGAPPDPLGPQGQDWGFPPMNPLVLEDEDLRGFRELVTANMRHAGAIRIDHAFQLERLYVSPLGLGARHGAYIAYPFEAMLAVLRIESHRACCMVIAEDLGTAPKNFSKRIMDAGMLSSRLLSFEREADGAFMPPDAYPREALASIGTHDLPTFAGWWRGLDIDLRECFGVFDPEHARRDRTARLGERAAFDTALAHERLPRETDPDTPPLTSALRYLARTRSCLAAVQIEDMAGDMQQPNLPGLSEGPPNWRRRMHDDLASFTAPGGPLAKAAAIMAGEGRALHARSPVASAPPRATYRLQFNADFTFAQAREIVPYLAELGISHVYASPIETAKTGSTHGYDVVDHTRINPALGGMEGFEALCEALHAHGMGLLLDIVPNHMGIEGGENGWWNSVLEFGRASPQATSFDIDWSREGAGGRVLLPVLGTPYPEALVNGDIALRFSPERHGFEITYFDKAFPVRPKTDGELLRLCADPPGALAGIARALAEADERPAEAAKARADLTHLLDDTPKLADALQSVAALVSAGADEGPASVLHRLVEDQHYRLGFWRLASTELNYRRFFEIAGLAGLRVEDARVFADSHALVFDLVRRGLVQGLRIDHVDGLAAPTSYLEALQASVGPGFYIVVEKILSAGEKLRPWPISGTTGYEVLADLDQVFVARENERAFSLLHRAETGETAAYEPTMFATKRAVAERSFGSETADLVRLLGTVKAHDFARRDLSLAALEIAVVDLLAAFPVYRTYMEEGPATQADRVVVARALERAHRFTASEDTSAHDWVAKVLCDGATGDGTDAARVFRRRFQQLSGPVMAKGVEDTLFYRYGRWLVLNEVGGDPSGFGLAPRDFHAVTAARAARWPNMLIATATHDTKRGEDARARLVGLTHEPELWQDIVARFDARAAQLETADGPDAQERYVLWQSLAGAWPSDLAASADRSSFRDRASAFALKAFREAKRNTSWTAPNEAREKALEAFLSGLLEDDAFVGDMTKLLAPVFARGLEVSLARLALKLTVPGVPDIYQGTESLDLSFVDPDNRRPVDYAANRAVLAAGASVPTDASAKAHLLRALLADRAKCPDLYSTGDYRPLLGDREDVLAFERVWRGERLLVIVRLGARVASPLAVPLPAGRWRNLVTGETLQSGGELALSEALRAWPAMALRNDA